MSDAAIVDAPVVETPVADPNSQSNAPAVPAKGASKERMFNVKINGKEEVWPESKVLERAQKSEGAEQAMKRSAQMEQAFESFVSKAQDPNQLLVLLQHPSLKYDETKQEMLFTKMLESKNPRIVQAAKKWIYDNEVAPSQMTPEQREIMELRKFKEQQLQDKEARENDQRTAKEQSDIQQAWTRLRAQIGSEVKAAGLPERESNVARVARYALLQKKQGMPVDIKSCVSLVKQDLMDEYKQLHSALDEGSILNFLDEETIKKINAAYTKKLQAAQDGGESKIKGSEQPKRKDKQKKLTPAEQRQWIRDLERGNI